MSDHGEEKKRRGRPQVLTLSAKKRKKSVLDAKWNKCRINMGEEIGRWNTLKTSLGVKSHADVAKILLDR